MEFINIKKLYLDMRKEVENRLHRVVIQLKKDNIKCPHSHVCDQAESCGRCNNFFSKCSLYLQKESKK